MNEQQANNKGLLDTDKLVSYLSTSNAQSRVTFKSEVLSQLGTSEEVAKALMFCYKYEVENRGMVFEECEGLRSIVCRASEWLINPHSRPWLMICGPVGNGKTTLLQAMQRLINSQKLRYGCHTTSLKAFNALRIADLAVQNREYYNEMKGFDALGIDDLGVEPLAMNYYGVMVAPIAELLLQRYQSRTFTLFTTNLDMDMIAEYYKERIVDRMREVCDTLYIPRESYRR